ncbi:MAG: hypothetical protein Q8Q09_29670 [Deltaproteobacteria bacterium]|nr:hypothetical protein [Deltaproteobacteria bacterium]
MDYQRFGKQIALPELGPDGQERLARVPVLFVGDPSACAFAVVIWRASGGVIPGDIATQSQPRVVTIQPAKGHADALALASWHCLNEARIALGWPDVPVPASLLTQPI